MLGHQRFFRLAARVLGERLGRAGRRRRGRGTGRAGLRRSAGGGRRRRRAGAARGPRSRTENDTRPRLSTVPASITSTGAKASQAPGLRVRAADGGRRAQDLGDHEHGSGEHEAGQPAPVERRRSSGGDQPGGGHQRGDGERGEQHVGDLEGAPRRLVAVPVQEQAHEQHEAAQRHDQRSDFESSHRLQVTRPARQRSASRQTVRPMTIRRRMHRVSSRL